LKKPRAAWEIIRKVQTLKETKEMGDSHRTVFIISYRGEKGDKLKGYKRQKKEKDKRDWDKRKTVRTKRRRTNETGKGVTSQRIGVGRSDTKKKKMMRTMGGRRKKIKRDGGTEEKGSRYVYGTGKGGCFKLGKNPC